MLRKAVVSCIVIIFVLLCCVKKQTWQGNYTTVSYTTTAPKEDFKVGEYIVVSYAPQEYDPESEVVYRFEVMKEHAVERVFEFAGHVFLITKKPEANIGDKDKDYDYSLMEIAPEDIGKQKTALFSRGTVHKLYENSHDYSEIKEEVIDVLMGIGLLPE